MIGINFDPDKLTEKTDRQWWNDWRIRANAATEKAIDAFESWVCGPRDKPFQFDFTNKIWTDLRTWLLEHVFSDKCAYCEREISGYWGDAEHFRPKGAVTFRNSDGDSVRAICEMRCGEQTMQIPHPGYFWLAYDWRNLVPACSFCNGGGGKVDQFPTMNGHILMLDDVGVVISGLPSKQFAKRYYPIPAVLDDQERPLLLNPLNPTDISDPRKHLRFGVRGTVAALNSDRGEATIEVFGLRKEKIRKARQKAQEAFQSEYFDAARRFDPTTPVSAVDILLTEYKAGKRPFSAAALDYHKILLDAIVKRT